MPSVFARILLVLVVILMLSDCTSWNDSQKTLASKSISLTKQKSTSLILVTDSLSQKDNANDGKISQCTRELTALKSLNNASYVRYQRQFEQLTRASVAYLDVAGGIDSDINDLVRPKYQYALSSLCWHIKNELSTALIKQVNTHD